MHQRFHAIFLFLSISALSAAFFACSAKNSSNADYIDDDYSSEYDEFSSSSDDLSGNASSSSGQKTSSSAETSSSSLTSSSSEEYVVSKTSALLDSIYDSRNSKTYKTVQIGSNVWLAQNLSYKTNKSKCYDDRLENCEVFGRMYKVYSDSVCPTGFSLPTKENWESLIKIAGSTGLLKTSRYWEKSDKGKRGNDSLGLSLVPGGLCREDKCAKLTSTLTTPSRIPQVPFTKSATKTTPLCSGPRKILPIPSMFRCVASRPHRACRPQKNSRRTATTEIRLLS